MNARYFSKRVFSTMDKFFDPSKDYYNMLGISQSSSSDQIQKSILNSLKSIIQIENMATSKNSLKYQMPTKS